MVHLVRNSLDHGLETPEERVAAGKDETGTLEISARHAGGNVVISVPDDGRGIDARRVAEKAAEKGLIPREAIDSIDMREGHRAALPPGLLDRRGAVRHLRPRRRHGRGAQHGARAGRRGARHLRARQGHRQPDPPAADAGDHVGAARRDERPAVRHPARPRRAHAASLRPHDPLGGGPAHARHARRRAADRRRLRRPRSRRPRATRRPTPSSSAPASSAWPSPSTTSSASGSSSRARSRRSSRPAPPSPAAPSSSDGNIALIVDCDALIGAGADSATSVIAA